MLRYILLIPYFIYLLFGVVVLINNDSQNNCYIFEYVISAMCFQSILVLMFIKNCITDRNHWFLLTICGITFTIWGGLETFGTNCALYDNTTLFTFSQITTVLQSIVYLTLITSILCDVIINDYQEI